MSMEESKIQKVCNCLSILTNNINIEPSENHPECHDIKESFTFELQRNIHATFRKLESYTDLKTYITGFIEPCLDEKCGSCNHLKYLQLCLLFLKLLHMALLEETGSSAINNEQSDTPIPKGILSISQQNVLKKCLQFTVALGILPNLLRGIGIPLSKRLRHAIILERFCSESSLCQKHVQLAICLELLITCLEAEAMQSIILTYHGTDLLAGLLQVCHAPIKKIDIKEESASHSSRSGKINFKLLLSAIEDSSAHCETEIVTMMLQHRKYFTCLLKLFLKQMCPSLLMWELLLFQGIPLKIESDTTIQKVPVWLRKICNQMLTDMLLQNNGISDLVHVVLDKAYDIGDFDSGKLDAMKLQAVARLVTYNPVKHITLPNYIQGLSKQIFQLFHRNGSMMDGILNYIAASIILQFCERDIKSAEEFLLVKLLKPLWCCVRDPTDLQAEVIVNESDLTTCLEDLHHIFVIYSTPLSRKYVKILYLFSHCLCSMFFCLLKTQLPLKDKAKSLIRNILQYSNEGESLSLLHAVSFSNNKLCNVYLTKVRFEASERGLRAVPKVEEDFCNENIRYHAILEILSELQNKDLNRSYILLVLKEFCTFHLESKDNIMDPENIKSGILFNALLHELSEWNVDIGEALMSNISEVIDILMTLLESICNCSSDATFYEKTLWVVLMILNSILESDDQLTSSDWSSLKKCLPSLQILQKSNIDSELKEIIFSIIIHIATNGAACKNGIEIMKEFMANLPENPTPNMKLTEQRMLQIVEKFEQGCEIDPTPSRKKPSKGGASAKHAASSKRQGERSTSKHTAAKKVDSSSSRNSKAEESSSKKQATVYELAIKDIKKSSVPFKGHGLIMLGKLLQSRDPEVQKNKKEIFKLLQENLDHEDSYVYLPVIQNLSLLADIDAELVLPLVLVLYQAEDETVDKRLKLGEVLLKICNSLGDMIYKYQDQLLHAYLTSTRFKDPQLRSSSLSNLGQACMYLKFNISSRWVQQILFCVVSYLKCDKDIEVRRCAIMVIYLLLKGVGKNIFKVLKNEMKTIYSLVKQSYEIENDDVLRLHAQLALEEINAIMTELICAKVPIQKEIRILQ